ncbi:MAG: hypothetical protein HZB57_08850 [Gammaproteobacteria bacterium]|nr:hypothetical protein [Gammaproteobacteria bacterium]
MPETTDAALGQILATYRNTPALRLLHDTFIEVTADNHTPDPSALIALYRESIRAFENRLPSVDYSDTELADYQRVCREYEARIASQSNDDRYSFVVIIPTADRPLHLQACLASLLELCRIFAYGGRANGRYRKVAAMIADDSKEESNIQKHRELARHFEALGLETLYFGLDEQLAELDRLPDNLRKDLGNILGDADRTAFYHKGHSVMRNIIYLRLAASYANDSKRLFYFADSDQEFKIKIGSSSGDRDVYALNYFYHLDRIFSDDTIHMLTGKVVGDPPVSPAVMAGNFLDDARAFLTRIEGHASDTPCPFHDQAPPADNGAAYHDMAGLFGFNTGPATHTYRCTLHGPHTIAACLDDFTRKLPRFFDGEHPTRITYFDAADSNTLDASGHDVAQVRPARTVYTGNYVIRAEALRYFVPFAPLRLRMSGPTFGRLLQTEIGARFVSANLPMLHKRTVHEIGAAEFRPGILKHAQHIDLTNEFERQFFGDVMLFSIEKLTARGYPLNELSGREIAETLLETADEMAQRYQDKHAQIVEKLLDLRQLLGTLNSRFTDTPDAWTRLDTFLDNMTHNFGPHAEGYRLIADAEHRQRRHDQLYAAIVDYRHDRTAWETALDASTSPASA